MVRELILYKISSSQNLPVFHEDWEEDMGVKEKVVIITGAAAGIGAATARLFARHGAHLSLIDINEEGLRKVETDCKAQNLNVLTLKRDASMVVEIERAIDATVQRFGGIDILINNAIYRPIGPFLEIKEEDFDRGMFTNIKGYFFFGQKVVPHMLKRGGGRVINIASTFAFVGSQNLSAYCTCKGAVATMTRAMALDLGPMNIYVNAVAPGPIMTEGMKDLIEQVPSVYESRVRDVPIGRFGTPEEMAEVCLFLSSEKCSYMNGSVLVADGGYLTH
jgi:NAD(P)-dependent dehydrogenase (short-subunit alcohol dehydrogenase family)